MPDTTADLSTTAPARPEASPVRAKPPLGSRLSARLLLLTIAFVMVAEVVMFPPVMARYRTSYLNTKLGNAHLIFTTLDGLARETGEIDPLLRDNLLSQGRILGMTVHRPDLPPRTYAPGIPSEVPLVFDLRRENLWDEMIEPIAVMFRRSSYAVLVTGISPSNPAVVVDVIFDERPLRSEMWDYTLRYFLAVSLFISTSTAALVYISLQWLAVRPLRKLTASMTGFQMAPEDPRSVIHPSARKDEVGVAERTLATMQHELREALLQKDRLAGVGTAVAKISHDLKNILATAMLESERLEALPDPEVKRLTAGMVRAVDRAVQLSTTTMRFAKEGLPLVRKQTLHLPTLLEEIRESVQRALRTSKIRVSSAPDLTFSGDPDLMHRTFENLLRNADEAGAGEVVIKAVEDGGYLTLHVIDNGPGLAPKARENLFVPFSGSTRAGGFGLGLPIARELMRVQGGDIMLLWTGPQGTCFVVRLPL